MIKNNFINRLGQIAEKPPCYLLFAILSLALILRVLALISLRDSIYFDYLLWDERLYHNWAVSILNKTGESFSICDFAPFPAYFMAAVYKLLSPDIFYIRITSIVFGLSTCFLIYLIGKEMLNSRLAGLFACLTASIYKPFIFYSIVPLKTSMSVFLFALTACLLMGILKRQSALKILTIGFIIGLMLNVRPNSIVFIPFTAVIIIWHIYREKASCSYASRDMPGFPGSVEDLKFRRWILASIKAFGLTLIIFIAGLSISSSPFIIRNYLVSGDLAGTTPQSGFNLYIGNNEQNREPYYNPVSFASSVPFEQGIHFAIEASRRTGEKMNQRESSSYWTGEVFRMARENPLVFLQKIFQKVLALFNQFERGDHYHIGFVSSFIPFFKIPFPGFAVILPFGMAGMIMTFFRSRKYFALSLMFFLYASTLIIFFISARYRLPLVVILIPFGIAGIYHLILSIRENKIRDAVIYAGAAAAFFAVEFLPVRGTRDMSLYYNTHAIILDSMGLEDEAVKYWEKSSEINNPSSAYADYSLSVKYIMRQDMDRAFGYLDKIDDDSFAAASKYELIGDIMVHWGQMDKAITAYEKSLEINSGQRRIRVKLSRIFWETDKKRALEEYGKLEYLDSFY